MNVIDGVNSEVELGCRVKAFSNLINMEVKHQLECLSRGADGESLQNHTQCVFEKTPVR